MQFHWLVNPGPCSSVDDFFMISLLFSPCIIILDMAALMIPHHSVVEPS